MLKSLRSRQVALMAGVLLLTQALTLALVVALALLPQVERVAGLLAHNVRMLSAAIEALPPAERRNFISRLNASGKLHILQGSAAPPGVDGRPTLLEQRTLRALATELGEQDTMVWRGGGGKQLWVRLQRAPHEAYWVTLAPSKGWSPSGALVGSIGLALAIALVAGVLLQRRVSRPLRALEEAVDAMPDARPVRLLSEHGPSEIASVARSFDRMAARLDAQERDRAFMLAGISHDLKTPIAKLRLAAALHPTGEPDHDAMVVRQLDRMDRMLGQFLDFGRGFGGEAAQNVDMGGVVTNALAGLDLQDAVRVHVAGTVTVQAPPMALERAVTNLLRNAVAHGAPPVTVACTGLADQVIVSITDAGPGIDPALLDKAHQPFVRGEDSRPSDGSVGLGLAIVDRVVTGSGGTLTLANAAGGGLVATIALPRAGG